MTQATKWTDQNQFFSFVKIALLAAMSVWAAPSLAETEDYINSTRPSSAIFISQSVDGDYGAYTLGSTTTASDGTQQKASTNSLWQGYGLSTSIAYETNKFLQFELGHTLLSMHDSSDTLAKLGGSRLHLGARLEFDSPLGNLEFGGGVLGSIMNYSRLLDNATYYGTGSYYSVGLNYFFNQRVSLYGEAKFDSEHLLKQGGGAPVTSIDAKTTEGSLGFRIWF